MILRELATVLNPYLESKGNQIDARGQRSAIEDGFRDVFQNGEVSVQLTRSLLREIFNQPLLPKGTRFIFH